MSEHESGTPEETRPVERTMGMRVTDVSFLLARLGADCGPLQYLRELTVNAWQAGATTIHWDVDHAVLDARGVRKLCVIDDGRGMTGDELIEYINSLAASGGVQGLGENFGLGAKIATATRNPAGVVYQSWKDNVGSMIWLRQDPDTGEYGLRQFPLPDGGFAYVLPLSDEDKPEIIDRHGTKVTLLGENQQDDTIEAPEGVPTPSAWLARHLNARWFELPEGVELRAREGWQLPQEDKHHYLRQVRGMRAFLERHSDRSGTVELTGCRVHWWLLADSEERKADAHYPRSGHVAALWQNELYELTTGRSGTARLHQFGILFGPDRVVLYVEPLARDGGQLTSNTARTELQLNHAPLPYADWATEFRSRMPAELSSYMEEFSANTKGRDHHESIRERLETVMHLFELSPPQKGARRPPPRSRIRGWRRPTGTGTPGGGATTAAPAPKSSPQGPSAPNADETGEDLLGAFVSKSRRRAAKSTRSVEPPRVVWVNEADGTRPPGFMDDRAAHYFAADNVLQINGDFRGFTDMIDYWCRQYGLGHRHPKVVDQVHEWNEQTLVEVIIGTRALEGEQQWSPADLEAARSEEALTTAVMARYHLFYAVKRGLGAKLGTLRDT